MFFFTLGSMGVQCTVTGAAVALEHWKSTRCNASGVDEVSAVAAMQDGSQRYYVQYDVFQANNFKCWKEVGSFMGS